MCKHLSHILIYRFPSNFPLSPSISFFSLLLLFFLLFASDWKVASFFLDALRELDELRRHSFCFYIAIAAHKESACIDGICVCASKERYNVELRWKLPVPRKRPGWFGTVRVLLGVGVGAGGGDTLNEGKNGLGLSWDPKWRRVTDAIISCIAHSLKVMVALSWSLTNQRLCCSRMR